MNKLMLISEVSQNYHVTKRTLRYYEEIGLLTNVKKNNSNYRCYDNETLARLEQILLLRELDFHINEIKEILLSNDEKITNDILFNKLRETEDNIKNLISLKNIITSIINIQNQTGMQSVNLYEILKEQIYIHKNMERMFEMSQFVGDIILVEFGINIVESANTIIDNIKLLREDIKDKLNKEIPLIRIKDNIELKDNEYRIIIKNITVKQELLDNITSNERASIILSKLKESLICNIRNLTE
ncbi:MerR family transcriptional regulator [Clostridium sp. C2-6-12]|uniref:helix-turn-helix domain-containing protein n=1 Tax=Clostridium sp. C2-6-12 TaxID=2698832 RepID=UPI00136E0EDC|nr:MerR family transcriptional regulator [Clostridium sp. C2-6-12]